MENASMAEAVRRSVSVGVIRDGFMVTVLFA